MMSSIITYTQNDIGFYPTPPELARRMLDGVDLDNVYSVLEPSAGKGNLAEVLKDKLSSVHWRRSDNIGEWIDCIEINPNLRYILDGKGFRIVHDDFLTYRTHKHYDLILMNPPFGNGDLHLLKALEMIQNGGAVVCLLNAETVRNRYTNTRKLLWDKLCGYNAKIEYIENAFSFAERKTDATIALIRVTVEPPERESFIFGELKKKTYEEIDAECKDLVAGDFISQIVKQYEMEIDGGIRLINEYRAMLPYIRRSFDEKKNDYPTIDMKIHGESDYSSTKISINGYVEIVRMKYWNALFQNDKFTGMLTSNLRDDLFEKVQTLKHYDFSLFNIRQIQEDIMRQMGKGVEDTIVALFDKLSAQFSWYPEMQKNIHYYNGWSTNKAHKINKKVIIPINGAFSYRWNNEAFEVYPVYKIMHDIEKTMSYLDTGSTVVEDDLNERLQICAKNGTTKNIQLRYFTITLYKKGTCHITFTNLDLLDKLNIYGSQKKGWLPPCYGKKHYADMTSEEKATVDSFQGPEEYAKVMEKPEYYLDDPAVIKQLMLPGVMG